MFWVKDMYRQCYCPVAENHEIVLGMTSNKPDGPVIGGFYETIGGNMRLVIGCPIFEHAFFKDKRWCGALTTNPVLLSWPPFFTKKQLEKIEEDK